jgi:hypothetical protein
MSANTVSSIAASLAKPDLDKKEKNVLGGFISGMVGKLGVGLIAKTIPKFVPPLRYAAAAIQLFNAASPVIKSLLERLSPKSHAPVAGQSQAPAQASQQAGNAAVFADPKIAQQLSQISQMGGLSAIQRAASEGRLPQDPNALADLYLSGARTALTEGFARAQSTMAETGNPEKATAEMRPYITDAKVSPDALRVLLDPNRSLEERVQAAMTVFSDLTRQQVAPEKAPIEQTAQPADKTVDPVAPTNNDLSQTMPQNDMARYLPLVIDRLSDSFKDVWTRWAQEHGINPEHDPLRVAGREPQTATPALPAILHQSMSPVAGLDRAR